MDKNIIYKGSNTPDFILIQCVDEHDLELLDKEFDYIKANTDKSFLLAAVKINAWNDELSPWQAAPVFGKEGFGGKADETLRFIEKKLISELTDNYGNAANFIIGGYSLAGLFALWSGYSSDKFFGIAAASPSVWFPNWIEYAEKSDFNAKKAYLSLGDKEEKTRNPIMASVGKNILRQKELLEKKKIPCTFEWNAGNHFKESDLRTAKAFLSILN